MKRIIPFFLILFFTVGVFAQGTITVTVTSSEKGTGLTVIVYEFTGLANTYDISAEVSFNNKVDYVDIPIDDLTGDLTDIAPGGPYTITWYGMASFPERYHEETVIRLTAFCPLPAAPVAKEATGIDTNTFTANWEEVTGAVTYTLELAVNPDFNPISESFIVDAGNISHTLANLTPLTIYHYRVKANDVCGTSEYSNTVSVTTASTWQPCPDMPTVTDIDGNTYNTVLIGTQCWMQENLRVTQYNDGENIPTNWDNEEGAYAIYPHSIIDGLNSDAEVVAAYGKLYNWYAAIDPRGLCPTGWHVPSESEWLALFAYVESHGFPNDHTDNPSAGNALKSCRQVGSQAGGDCDTSDHPRWNSDATHYGTDEFGFSALPGGYRWSSDNSFSFIQVGLIGHWWSATENSSQTDAALNWYMSIASGGVIENPTGNKANGFSVRCVKD